MNVEKDLLTWVRMTVWAVLVGGPVYAAPLPIRCLTETENNYDGF